MKHWPFKVVNEGGRPKVQVTHCGETKTFYAEEIEAMILHKLKETAEAYLGEVKEPYILFSFFSHKYLYNLSSLPIIITAR